VLEPFPRVVVPGATLSERRITVNRDDTAGPPGRGLTRSGGVRRRFVPPSEHAALAAIGLGLASSRCRAPRSAAVHVVGSSNSLVPWTGKTAPTTEQLAEVAARTAGDLALIRDTFAHARDEGSKAVVLNLQADMFDPTVPNPVFADWSGFQTIVQTIAREAAGDSPPGRP
jgi:hypothetical protein